MKNMIRSFYECNKGKCIEGKDWKRYDICDFTFLDGEFSIDALKSDFEYIVIALSDAYKNYFENNDEFAKFKRYQMKANDFNISYLENIVLGLNSEFSLKIIDEEIYKKTFENFWSESLCMAFENYLDFKENGLGYAIVKGNEFIAGVSSYTIYNDGFEIEIDVREDYQGLGLGKILGAKFILETLKLKKIPYWDAHTIISKNLSEKLGYQLVREYDAFIRKRDL